MSIIAVGSPHGDDQIGWRVVERVWRKPRPGIHAAVVSEPIGVLNYLEDCETLVLVDACRSGVRAGTIHHLVWPDLRLQAYNNESTHGFGVAQVLELAAALDRLPTHVVLIGVEAQTCNPTAEMSAPVRRALPALYRQVLAAARRRRSGFGETGRQNP